MARFHALRVVPRLLGGWTPVRADAFATEDAAVVELEWMARRKRGYADSPRAPTAVDTDRSGRGRA